MKIAVITDSGSNLNPAFVEKHKNLQVIPLMIVRDGEQFRDQIDITAEQIYKEIDQRNFSTSLPPMSALEAAIENVKKDGYTDVLVINISSGLSGTYNAFRLTLHEVSGVIVHQYDTKTLGAGQGYLVEYALELIEAGKQPHQIFEALDQCRFEDSLAIYTINTLKYLKKGGRIGKVEGTIGDILHIKPVITVNNDGVYVTLSKAIGMQRSLLNMKDLMVKKFGDSLIDLTVHYGDDLEKASQLGSMMSKALNVRNLNISALTPVLGIHTGPQMFAYVARRVKEQRGE